MVYSFFAPTILRIGAALVLLYVAVVAVRRRREIAHYTLPLVRGGAWVAWCSAALHGMLAFMLGSGYYTQVAAILGMLASIKGFLLTRRYLALFPLSRSAYALLFFILLSLLLSGAGALAFDLPL